MEKNAYFQCFKNPAFLQKLIDRKVTRNKMHYFQVCSPDHPEISDARYNRVNLIVQTSISTALILHNVKSKFMIFVAWKQMHTGSYMCNGGDYHNVICTKVMLSAKSNFICK